MASASIGTGLNNFLFSISSYRERRPEKLAFAVYRLLVVPYDRDFTQISTFPTIVGQMFVRTNFGERSLPRKKTFVSRSSMI